MEALYAISLGVLSACGIFLLLRARTFPVVLGLTLLSYAVNLFLFAMGRLKSGAPAVIGAAAEAADHRDVGRHHRDLSELGQRKRDREFQRLGKLKRKMAAGNGAGSGRNRCGFDFVERGHCRRITPTEVEKVTAPLRI